MKLPSDFAKKISETLSMAALDEQFRCLNCYMTFDATEGSFETVQVQRQDEFREKLIIICPRCGARTLKPLSPTGIARTLFPEVQT